MTTKPDTSLHTCEGARLEVLELHRTKDMSWPKIAQKAKYRGIPMTSLYMWATGKRKLKSEYRKKLGITNEAAEYRRKRRAELKAKFQAAGWASQYEYLQYVLDDKIEVSRKPLD